MRLTREQEGRDTDRQVIERIGWHITEGAGWGINPEPSISQRDALDALDTFHRWEVHKSAKEYWACVWAAPNTEPGFGWGPSAALAACAAILDLDLEDPS